MVFPFKGIWWNRRFFKFGTWNVQRIAYSRNGERNLSKFIGWSQRQQQACQGRVWTFIYQSSNKFSRNNYANTLKFISEAIKSIRDGGIFVLRVSDYNTTGLKGAFSDNKITPWKSLVQGNAFSVKSTDNAAGSYASCFVWRWKYVQTRRRYCKLLK